MYTCIHTHHSKVYQGLIVFFHGGTPVGIKSIARLIRIISDAGSCGNHCGKSVCAGRLVTVKRRLALTFHPWTTTYSSRANEELPILSIYESEAFAPIHPHSVGSVPRYFTYCA